MPAIVLLVQILQTYGNSLIRNSNPDEGGSPCTIILFLFLLHNFFFQGYAAALRTHLYEIAPPQGQGQLGRSLMLLPSLPLHEGTTSPLQKTADVS
jgi:hypothetical protein